jgi:hypothetical protein
MTRGPRVGRRALGRFLVLASFTVIVVSGCAEAPASPSANEEGPALSALDLQVRNSGLPGGYLWLAMADQRNTGRWHRFWMAEFMCVTCPRPFGGIGTGYEIAVFDEACQLRARFRTPGGALQVAIDPGPTITLDVAPPLGDWLPGDSIPADPATIPCSPP